MLVFVHVKKTSNDLQFASLQMLPRVIEKLFLKEQLCKSVIFSVT